MEGVRQIKRFRDNDEALVVAAYPVGTRLASACRLAASRLGIDWLIVAIEKTTDCAQTTTIDHLITAQPFAGRPRALAAAHSPPPAK